MASIKSSNFCSLFIPLFCLAVVAINLIGAQTLGRIDVPCPLRAASGRIEAGQVQVVFHSPKSKRDITIDYDGSDWSKSFQANKLQGFNSSNSNAVYMHAYTQSSSSNWLQDVRRHYDQDGYRGQFNLMIFDWSYFSRQRYDSSARWAPKLGEVLAKFLRQLQKFVQQSDPAAAATMFSRTHLVSYSLSTHIAGLAGRQLRAEGDTIGRITALDPTGVCFHQKNSQFASQYSLRPSDANLVVARHYDMGTLGASRPIGGLDVFVNGGKNQPSPASRGLGLWPLARAVGFQVPSHMMASLNEVQDQVGDCRNVAYACTSYKAFLAGECADCGRQNSKCIDLNTMDATKAMSRPGNNQNRYRAGTHMFIKTSQESGCIYHYQAVLRLRSEPTRAQKKLIEDSLSFIFVSNNNNNQLRNRKAKVNHQPDGERLLYTALLTTENGQLANSHKIQMQLQSASSSNASNRQQQQQQQQQKQKQSNELANLIDSLELNYMSHDVSSERAKKSAKFCVASNDSLQKC